MKLEYIDVMLTPAELLALGKATDHFTVVGSHARVIFGLSQKEEGWESGEQYFVDLAARVKCVKIAIAEVIVVS